MLDVKQEGSNYCKYQFLKSSCLTKYLNSSFFRGTLFSIATTSSIFNLWSSRTGVWPVCWSLWGISSPPLGRCRLAPTNLQSCTLGNPPSRALLATPLNVWFDKVCLLYYKIYGNFELCTFINRSIYGKIVFITPGCNISKCPSGLSSF